MKRKSLESESTNDAQPTSESEQSSKRPKLIVTAVTELKRIEPIRKQLGLRGKGLLRQMLKEQQIRLTQRQRRSDVLQAQLKGVKEYQSDLENVLCSTKQSWTKLEAQLRAILMVRNTESLRTNLPDIANTALWTELSKFASQYGDKSSGTEENSSAWPNDDNEQKLIRWTKKLIVEILDIFKAQASSAAKVRAEVLVNSGIDSARLVVLKKDIASEDQRRLEITKLTNELLLLQSKEYEIRWKLADATGRISWLEDENHQIVLMYNNLVRNYTHKCLQKEKERVEMKLNESKEESAGFGEEYAEGSIGAKNRQLKLRLEEIRDIGNEVISLEKQLNLIKREKTELKSQVDAFISLCYGRESEAVEMAQTRETLNLALMESKKRHKEDISRLENEQEQLRRRFRKQIEAAQQEAIHCRTLMHRHLSQLERLGDVSKYKDLIKVFEEQNNDLCKELGKLRTENAKLYEQFGTQKLKEENQELKKRIGKLETAKLRRAWEALPPDTRSQYKKCVEQIVIIQRNKVQESKDAQKTIQLLSQQLNKSAKAVSDCQTRHEEEEKNMLEKIKNVTEQNTNLVNQSATWNVRLKQSNEEKKQLLMKIAKLNEILRSQQLATQNYQIRVTNSQERLKHIKNEYNASQKTCGSLKRETELSNQKVSALAVKAKAKEKLIDQCLSEVQTKTEDLRKALSSIKRLEEKQLTAKRKHGRILRKDYEEHEIEVLKTQIEILQGKLSCTLCRIRQKEVVMGCSHLFCKSCITSLMKSRNRKCPICRERVSQPIKFQL